MHNKEHHLRIHTPIESKERINELDMIRGVALLGILIANIPLFSYPYAYINMLHEPWWTNVWDQMIKQFIYIFVEYKFVTMFSFLFGLGFMIFLQRAQQKGKNSVWLYLKRLFILLLFGLIHSYLIWFGDILFLYAFLGFFLILFRHCRAKTLLSWAAGLLLIPAVLNAVQILIWGNGLSKIGPPAETIQSLIQDSLYAYGQGTYMEILGQRVVDLSILQESSLFYFPLALAMFLLGAYTWKKGVFQNLSQHITRIRQIWLWSLIIGVPFLLLQLFLYNQVDALHPGYNFAHYTGILISGPALCLFYVSSLILLLRYKLWKKLLTPLQAVGRMALTNYIMQSVICTFLFYSYGLGWYNQVGPALGVIVSIVLFVLQVIGSHLWLNYFRFGPLEWLWRSLTYGKWQSIKKPQLR